MYLSRLKIKDHPILKDLEIDLVNPKTNKPYSVIAFVGENGCGKTTLLNTIFERQDLKVVYLRQGSVHNNAMREVRKLIDGNDILLSKNSPGSKETEPYNPEYWAMRENPDKRLKTLQSLGDEKIYNLFKYNEIDEVYCSQQVSKVISGKSGGQSIDVYSSGQQEIVLKLKELRKMYVETDCVLLDEPETSLHPRWQLEIVDLLRSITKDTLGEYPQFILATHSEKVLQSLINNEDALIIRLFKENDVIKTETISQMELLLRKVTFAELDYVVFKMDTFEYCSQLFDLLEWIYDVHGDRGVDRHIQRSTFYNDTIHHKEWFNDKEGKVTCYTLPVYVRNYFHHPKDRQEPTNEELHIAIELLRNIVKDLNNN